ncbi:MAG: hypothetical protein AAGA75_23845 [Cyanobacteria bacterium P01_E01_bin.6]
MKLFIIDTSVVAHLMCSRLCQYTLSDEERELYVKASLHWINALGMIPYFADAQECHCIWAMDSKPYWRSRILPTYKGNRSPSSHEVSLVLDIVRELNFQTIEFTGYEADDIAALFCAVYHRRPIRSTWESINLLTIDTDWQGLVSDGITWMDINGHEPRVRNIDALYQWFEGKHAKQPKKWQQAYPLPSVSEFRPSNIWQWKSVVGDRSDNLPPGSPIGLIDLYQPPDEFRLWADSAIVQKIEQTIRRLTKPTYSATDMTKIINGLGLSMPLSYIVL